MNRGLSPRFSSSGSMNRGLCPCFFTSGIRYHSLPSRKRSQTEGLRKPAVFLRYTRIASKVVCKPHASMATVLVPHLGWCQSPFQNRLVSLPDTGNSSCCGVCPNGGGGPTRGLRYGFNGCGVQPDSSYRSRWGHFVCCCFSFVHCRCVQPNLICSAQRSGCCSVSCRGSVLRL